MEIEGPHYEINISMSNPTLEDEENSDVPQPNLILGMDEEGQFTLIHRHQDDPELVVSAKDAHILLNGLMHSEKIQPETDGEVPGNEALQEMTRDAPASLAGH